MQTTIKKSDGQIKSDVLAELKYEPSVKVTDIDVLVKDGTVTLTGFATSYGEKWNAVKATKRIGGVVAIADDIEIKMSDSQHRSDGDIAAAAASHLNSSLTIPKGSTQITVREGWVTIDGEVEWWYQKSAAENNVRYLAGVKGVTNLVTIKPQLKALDIEAAIKSSFERSAMLDAKKIQVTTSGNKVTLNGHVRNYDEREEAERVAWGAGGVFHVDNQLKVEW